MTVGANIQRLREERNLTQSELAGHIGISQVHLSHIERGVKVPTVSVVIQLADALDCTTDELLGRRAKRGH